MLHTLMALSLLAVPAHANGGCNCEVGSHEYEVWWCSHKDDKVNCENPDQVKCKWANEACIPANENN